MNKNKTTLKIIIFCLTLIIITQITSPQIYIQDNILKNYNIGEEINLSFEIKQSIPTMDFVEANLICNNQENLIFKEFISFLNTNSHSFNKKFITDLQGNCTVEISFQDKKQKTSQFNVNSNLQTEIILNSKVFQPNDKISIEWTIKKYNTNQFNYDIEILLDQNQITKQHFNTTSQTHSFNLENNLRAKEYNLTIKFTEKNIFDQEINSAKHTEKITILAKPKTIEIQTQEEFKPPHDLKIKTTLLDQSNNPIQNESIIIKIFDKNNNLFHQETIKSEKETTINFPSNSEIGGWRINAFYADLTSTKPIYIRENKEISIKIKNQTSHIKIQNTGNIEYKGIVEIKLQNQSGEFTHDININLKKGEQKNYELAHTGEFDITVNGETHKNILITGAVVSSNLKINYKILIITIIIITILIILLIFINKKRKQQKQEEKGGFLLSNKRKIKFLWPKKNKQETKENKEEKISKEEINKTINLSTFKKQLTEAEKNNQKEINKEKKIPTQTYQDKKRIYSLFFKKTESQEISDLFKKYSLNLYTSNDIKFSLIKSSKNPEPMLIKLAKIIANITKDPNIILHSTSSENTKNLSTHLEHFKEILNTKPGLIITDPIYQKIHEKQDFIFYKNIIYKDNFIKLYRLKN